MQRGYEKSRFSTTISLYLKNDTRYGHSMKFIDYNVAMTFILIIIIIIVTMECE